MMGAFDGQVAIVTGGSAGVGRAVALALAAEGAAVGVVARGEDGLRAVVREIEGAGGKALALPADVTDEAAIGGAIERAVAELGGLDIVIANVGRGQRGPVESMALSEWNATLATNLTAPFLTARAAIPHLRARGGGQIIAVSSGAGKRGYAGMAAYCAAKFGLHGLMESLAEEVGREGIRCGIVVPGSILTGFGSRSIEEKRGSDAKYLAPEDVAASILHQLRQPAHARIQELWLWPF
jgi:3-oxoacyl-[acyl-carrier protein] reductase